MKVTVRVLKEVKFIINLTSEDGIGSGYILLTPGILVSVWYYEEINNKWILGKLELRDGIIWFIRELGRVEGNPIEGIETWPVDEKFLEDTNLYSFWDPDYKTKEEKGLEKLEGDISSALSSNKI